MHPPEPSGDEFRLEWSEFDSRREQIEAGVADGWLDVQAHKNVFSQLIVLEGQLRTFPSRLFDWHLVSEI